MWFIILIAAIIAVAFLVSILPQEIIWVVFILMFGVLAVILALKTNIFKN
jgi:hypothetical protein